MSNLNLALISAFTGAFSAFILAFLKEFFSNCKKQKKALIETRYLIRKYKQHVAFTNSWYQGNKQSYQKTLRLDIDDNSLDTYLNERYKKSLVYGIQDTDDLESMTGLKFKVDDLSFLIIKDELLLDLILKTKMQYARLIRLVNQRNEYLTKLKEEFQKARIEEIDKILRHFEYDIVSITDNLLSTLECARCDIESSLSYVEKKLKPLIIV